MSRAERNARRDPSGLSDGPTFSVPAAGLLSSVCRRFDGRSLLENGLARQSAIDGLPVQRTAPVDLHAGRHLDRFDRIAGASARFGRDLRFRMRPMVSSPNVPPMYAQKACPNRYGK